LTARRLFKRRKKIFLGRRGGGGRKGELKRLNKNMNIFASDPLQTLMKICVYKEPAYQEKLKLQMV
jgi:hypothetical protein